MKNIVNSYVRRFRTERRRSRRAIAMLLALALLVATGVTWQLHSTGIALTNETYCGQEEHTHTEECYGTVLSCGLAESEGHTHTEDCYETVTTLVCGQEESAGHTHDESCYDEEGSLICGQEESEGHTHTEDCYVTEEVLICGLEESEGHTHTEECYEEQLICGLEEHTHTVECLIDETADVETASDWEATIPSLSGDWAEDLVSVAKSQLGYAESTANYTLADDGETHKGYTRYGAWYGNKYGDWDAMFVSFCLHYAGVPSSYITQASGAYAWTAALSGSDYYTTASDYTPEPGDIVFFDRNSDGVVDCTGIVITVSGSDMTVIEGNSGDAVEQNTYDIADAFGFVSVSAAYAEAAEAVGYDTEDEDTGMAALDITFLADGQEVEPTQAVTVTIDASAILPEEADASTIEVQHLEETEEGVEPVLVADATENTEGTVDAEAVVEFEVEGFSTFTIRWGLTLGNTSDYEVSITTKANLLLAWDTSKNETTSTELSASASYSTISLGYNDTMYFSESNASLAIDGYTLVSATVVYGSGSSSTTYTASAITIEREELYSTTSTSGTTTTTTTIYKLTYVITTDDGEITLATVYQREVITATTSSQNNQTSYSFSYTYSASATENSNGSYSLGTTSSLSNLVSDISITLNYIVTPTITISDSSSGLTSTLTATGEGTYTYTITDWSVDDTSKATITKNDDGTATLTWSASATTGDTVTATVTATYTDYQGNTQTITSSYTLTYNLTSYEITVTYGGSSTTAGIVVAFYDSDGNLVATETTNSSGQITVSLDPNETYTVVASYVITSGSGQQATYTAYTYSGEVTGGVFTADGSTTTTTNRINLTTGETVYEHIDVKDSVTTSSSTGESSAEIGTIVSIVVYDAGGNVIYTSSGVPYSTDGSNWQGMFEGYHHIGFLDSYSVVISYTIAGSNTVYTATFNSESVYGDNTYYPADGTNAYKLYNYIHNTSYTAATWAESEYYGNIDISGMNIYLVASILCDSSIVSVDSTSGATHGSLSGATDKDGNTTWGLDFALSVETLISYSANFNLEVYKTYKGASMSANDFTFYLYAATVDATSGAWSISGDALQTVTNSAATADSTTENSTTTIDFSAIAYGTSDAGTYYYIIYEADGGTTSNGTTYDGTVYGVKVVVSTSTSTSGTVTTTNTIVTKTYYVLTATTVDGVTTYTAAVTNEVTENSSGEAVFSFTNTYSSGTSFTILKVDSTNSSTVLSGAEFTLTITANDETTYYKADGTVGSSTDTLTTGEDGKISITGLTDGTYTLTEVTAPDGYNLLTDSIVFTVNNGTVTLADGTSTSVATLNGTVITVYNTAGFELPSTGGMGTLLYTLAGLVLCGGAALVLYRRKRLS
ncbi:MAG: CHAP domain-containing protein [Oscillospiraceae bacterium]|nr:CHAP domain-containing protein [Oscillospiraceae bacterium]